jgi:hypothetical protein
VAELRVWDFGRQSLGQLPSEFFTFGREVSFFFPSKVGQIGGI